LLRLHQELRLLNESAARSLLEGWRKPLTLHASGSSRSSGSGLKTTNCLESLNSLVAQRVGRSDHWRTSDQKQRWLAAALLDIEPRLRRIKGFRALPLLRQALRTAVQGGERTAAIRPPNIMTRSSLREDQLTLALTRCRGSGPITGANHSIRHRQCNGKVVGIG